MVKLFEGNCLLIITEYLICVSIVWGGGYGMGFWIWMSWAMGVWNMDGVGMAIWIGAGDIDEVGWELGVRYVFSNGGLCTKGKVGLEMGVGVLCSLPTMAWHILVITCIYVLEAQKRTRCKNINLNKNS